MIKSINVFIILTVVMFSYDARALKLEVDVFSKDYVPYNLLISDFYTTKDTEDYYQRIKDIVVKDLEDSGMFLVRSPKENFVNEDSDLLNLELNLDTYLYYDATMLGKFIYNPTSKEFTLAYIIVSNATKQIMAKYGYKIAKSDMKQELSTIAHEIADSYYKAITGRDSYFNSYLVYANENKLMVAEYNGENSRVLLQNKGKIYGPVVSKAGDLIAYVSFEKGLSSIYLYDVYFKKAIKLADLQGLSLSPRFSQDSKEILFSQVKEGSSNIFKLNIETKKLTKLTNSYSINLLGGYSKDGEKIVFYSDRIGRPNIYIMNKDGSTVRKISKGSDSYYTPSFSQDKESDLILFTKISKANFYIGLMSFEGEEKIVAEDSFVESPIWLNDNRHIMYQYKYNKDDYAFYIMDLISGYKVKVSPSKNSQYPYLSQNISINQKNSIKYIP